MIYLLQAGPGGPIKIGHTNDLPRRIALLQTGCADTLQLLGAYEGNPGDERVIHRTLAAHRIRGEWFRPDAEVLACCASRVAITIKPKREGRLRCGEWSWSEEAKARHRDRARERTKRPGYAEWAAANGRRVGAILRERNVKHYWGHGMEWRGKSLVRHEAEELARHLGTTAEDVLARVKPGSIESIVPPLSWFLNSHPPSPPAPQSQEAA